MKMLTLLQIALGIMAVGFFWFDLPHTAFFAAGLVGGIAIPRFLIRGE